MEIKGNIYFTKISNIIIIIVIDNNSFCYLFKRYLPAIN